MWFGGLWGEDDAEHAGAPASASSSPSLRSACCRTDDSAGGQESSVPAMTHLGSQLVVMLWCFSGVQ